MIALDTNILVYAHREDSPWHSAALRAVTHLAEGARRWCIPWPVVHEFIAIVTHPRIYNPPSPLELALKTVDSWFESPQITLIAEGPAYFERLKSVSKRARVKGAKVHDARVAALCLEHGVRELWSADRDFSRFQGIRVKNPLL